MENKIILKFNNDNFDLDRIITFIGEKCKQEKIDFNITTEGSPGQYVLAEKRKLFNRPIELGNKIAVRILTPRTKRFGFEPYELCVSQIQVPKWLECLFTSD